VRPATTVTGELSKGRMARVGEKRPPPHSRMGVSLQRPVLRSALGPSSHMVRQSASCSRPRYSTQTFIVEIRRHLARLTLSGVKSRARSWMGGQLTASKDSPFTQNCNSAQTENAPYASKGRAHVARCLRGFVHLPAPQPRRSPGAPLRNKSEVGLISRPRARLNPTLRTLTDVRTERKDAGPYLSLVR
jgi:hypothetical protein